MSMVQSKKRTCCPNGQRKNPLNELCEKKNKTNKIRYSTNILSKKGDSQTIKYKKSNLYATQGKASKIVFLMC